MFKEPDRAVVATINFCLYRNNCEANIGVTPGRREGKFDVGAPLSDLMVWRESDAPPRLAEMIATDTRFQQLLGNAAWLSLPATTRARFGRKVKAGQTVTYLGEVTHYQTNWVGRALAQLARIIGGPLPLHADTGTAAAVTVTEDEAEGGQIWTRQYGRHKGFPQVIHSVKRFAGVTGLEEYLGFGFGIALRLKVTDGVLLFESDHYFWRAGKRRLRLPVWVAPGALTIGHIDHADGWFTFTLDLHHPRFGQLIQQVCRFTEAKPGAAQ